MMMMTGMDKEEKKFDVVSEVLEQLGEEIGVMIKCQREDIFDKMHRI